MKKRTYLSLAGQFATLLLLSKSSPAFAAPIHMITPRTPIVQIATSIPAEIEGRTPWRYGHANANNQYLGGHCNYHGITRYYRGNNMSNNGNRGYNRGFNQDNNTNAGNQLNNQGLFGRGQGHNQYFQNCVVINVHTYNIGNNQANSGNGGYNSGFNQDNNTNEGNQIIN